MANQKGIKPTYSLKSLRFENFKGIKLIELNNLPEGAPWIFLTGENGFGKTSVLQAIAAALNGMDGYLFELFKDLLKKEMPISSLACSLNNKKDTYKLSHRNLYGNKPLGFPKLDELACYGSSRLDTYTESSTQQSAESNTKNLYDSRTLLENIEYQLSRWYAAKREYQEFNTKYRSTQKLLIDILQLEDIKINLKKNQVLYIEKDKEGNAYTPLRLSQLAAGYRSLIVMIGDMILRLFRTQPKVLDPKDLKGIVIIDEFDLHFHPKWQKRLPQILSKHFPYIQFIASTHSPIPLLGAPKGSVFLTVQRSEEQGITLQRLNHLEKKLPTLTPNLLLNSPLFGYAELFAAQFRSDQFIQTENTQAEVIFNEQLKKSLEKGLSPEKKEAIRKLMNKG